MKFNVGKIEKELRSVLKKEYVASKSFMYIIVDRINYDVAMEVCELKGRYGLENQDEKSWQKDFVLWVDVSDMTNYSYLQGAFAQYIFDKENIE